MAVFFCGGVLLVFVWLCFCGGVLAVLFLWWCGGVGLLWCFCGGVVVGVVVFLWSCRCGTFAFRFVGCCFDVLSPLFFQESHHFAFFASSVKLGDLKAACIVQVHAYVCNTKVVVLCSKE